MKGCGGFMYSLRRPYLYTSTGKGGFVVDAAQIVPPPRPIQKESDKERSEAQMLKLFSQPGGPISSGITSNKNLGARSL